MEKSKKIILVIDDSQSIRKEVKAILELDSFIVREAEDEASMLAAIEQDNILPDLILMDITLVDTDGFKLTSFLKDNEKYCNIPVIILTVHADKNNVELAKLIGVCGYIIKPINGAVLKNKITEQLIKKDKYQNV